MKMILFRVMVTGMELLLPAVLLLPFLIFAARKRGFGVGVTLGYGLFFLYLCGVYTVTGLPTLRYFSWEPEMYLIPFVGMADDIENSILNVALFIPMGFFLPLLCGRFQNMRKTVLFGLGATLFVELLQLFNFRLTDVNDILTNFAGCWLGYGLFACLKKRWSGAPEEPGFLYGVMGVVLGYFFFVQPYLLPIVWEWLYG